MTRKLLILMIAVSEVVFSLFYLLILLYLRNPIDNYLCYLAFILCIMVNRFIIQLFAARIAALTRLEANCDEKMSVFMYLIQMVLIRYDNSKGAYFVESRLMWLGTFIIFTELLSQSYMDDIGLLSLVLLYLPIGIASLDLYKMFFVEAIKCRK